MYDFDKVINRRETDSFKWNVKENELPMWVADMDFEAAPDIVEAFRERLSLPVFGYGRLPDEWYDAYINWWKKRHRFEMKKNSLLFCSGVVPGITSVIRHFTAPGDEIIMLSPTYNHFYQCIEGNGRGVREVELDYSECQYRVNFERLEHTLTESGAKLMILCNPQNPTGTVWDKDDLNRIGELCAEHHTVVISDEIHCDIITPGKEYVPFASASDVCRENSTTFIAPTKAFNLAGLQTAAAYVENSSLKKRVKSAIERDELSMPNSFASTAAIAAFTKGEAWIAELNEYIYENKMIVRDFLNSELPQIKLVWGDGTYLLWLDCSSLDMDSRKLVSAIRKTTGLFLMPGSDYGRGGRNFLRMNIACPKSVLKDGLERLKKAVLYIHGKSGSAFNEGNDLNELPILLDKESE